MATVTELLEEVMALTEAYHLQLRLEAFAPDAIKTAHSYQMFNRDLRKQQLINLTRTRDVVSVSSNSIPRLRRVDRIIGYGGYTVLGTPPAEYYTSGNVLLSTNSNLTEEPANLEDYYGFCPTIGYRQFAGNLLIYGALDNVDLLDIHYIS